jgi:hypothetical protein
MLNKNTINKKVNIFFIFLLSRRFNRYYDEACFALKNGQAHNMRYLSVEVVSKRLSLSKIKEGENYNHRNISRILRIII